MPSAIAFRFFRRAGFPNGLWFCQAGRGADENLAGWNIPPPSALHLPVRSQRGFSTRDAFFQSGVAGGWILNGMARAIPLRLPVISPCGVSKRVAVFPSGARGGRRHNGMARTIPVRPSPSGYFTAGFPSVTRVFQA